MKRMLKKEREWLNHFSSRKVAGGMGYASKNKQKSTNTIFSRKFHKKCFNNNKTMNNFKEKFFNFFKFI